MSIDELKKYEYTKEQKGKIAQMAQELADNLNRNVKKDPNLSDLCKCGHTYGSHTALNRFEDGSPIPPGHSCNSCKCQKFELKSETQRGLTEKAEKLP